MKQLKRLQNLQLQQKQLLNQHNQQSLHKVKILKQPIQILSSSEAAAKEEIAQRESSGSYTAQNGQYYGRYQLASSYLNGDLSPENQEKVADNYVASRYGSWTAALAFWNANGWY